MIGHDWYFYWLAICGIPAQWWIGFNLGKGILVAFTIFQEFKRFMELKKNDQLTR